MLSSHLEIALERQTSALVSPGHPQKRRDVGNDTVGGASDSGSGQNLRSRNIFDVQRHLRAACIAGSLQILQHLL